MEWLWARPQREGIKVQWSPDRDTLFIREKKPTSRECASRTLVISVPGPLPSREREPYRILNNEDKTE